MVGGSKVQEEDNYREYFMPVNEIKKSFRGEKMYVNKPLKKSGNTRRVYWWLLGLALLVAAITVAVLVGSK